METTFGCMKTQLSLLNLNPTPPGSFRIQRSPKNSKTLEFFDELYTYPPKFRVKWDTIDELHEDLFMSYNYRLLGNSVSFNDVLKEFVYNEENEPIKKTLYGFSSYVEGYLNKITSTQFYGGNAKRLQEVLQTIPIYVILNGQGEIVLANSTDSLTSNMNNLNHTIYDFCGSFDALSESGTQLGLFFLSRKDADVYLNEIAKSDTQGTSRFGLSVHCFGLDFAYRVTREYNPSIDFRFIPDLSEVQQLMTSQNTGDSKLIFEDAQQQLRFRRRSVNIVPVFNILNKWFSPFYSFLEKTEYYKGVPIYLVQVNTIPTNFFVGRYNEMHSFVEGIYSKAFNLVGKVFGFGNSLILQGSLSEQTLAPNTQTYVFFEKSMATDFCHRHARKLSSYRGKRFTLIPSLATKPRILAYNLEDLLEMWEDSFVSSKSNTVAAIENIPLDLKTVKLIPATHSSLDLETYLEQPTKETFTKISQFFGFKYRRLAGFVETILNTN